MFEDEYTLSKQLGKGSFGEVYLTTKKGSSKKYATKILDKKKFSRNEKIKSYLDNEIAILNEINHPNIVNLIDIQETPELCYIVTEYCNGGSLSSCLKQYQEKYGTAFPEEIVQHIMRQVMDAMKYLHEKKILHRDLKSDNILINYDNEDDKKNNNIIKGKIKIIDFGFARYLTKELAGSAIGTPIYMDPGILLKLNKDKNYANYAYDEKADIWSLGIICYELLVGKTAYDSNSMEELLKKIKKGTYTLPENISKEAKSFIDCMLQSEPKKRLSAKSLCLHEFIKNESDESDDELSLDKMFWKGFDEMNFDSISIQPKFIPFIPGIDFKNTFINII